MSDDVKPQGDDTGPLRCKVCSAHATGFHFDAQVVRLMISSSHNGKACSACAAFFRRAVALGKSFACITSNDDCIVNYEMHQICRSCRYTKCLRAGMQTQGVQPKRTGSAQRRAFCTASGLKRNKRFAASVLVPLPASENAPKKSNASDEIAPSPSGSSYAATLTSCSPPSSPFFATVSNAGVDALDRLIREEERVGERRRILFCERPVARLLGVNRQCPFTASDLRPLSFHEFRKSIRTHILLIHEWLHAWTDYLKLTPEDRVSFLRKCVLFHTFLDPVYISMQIGYPDRFVMQNGGYVSLRNGCEDGWQDEPEITGQTKRNIYGPLIEKVLSEIVRPLLQHGLFFEEFVALKALVSWQGALENVSEGARPAMRRQLDALILSLFRLYVERGEPEPATRLGNIILIMSAIFSTGLEFVVSHRQVEIFDLWQLDSLMLQFLQLDSVLNAQPRGA